MKRRDFLKASAACGVAAATTQGLPIVSQRSVAHATVIGKQPHPQPEPLSAIHLSMEPTLWEMSDTRLVNAWAYRTVATTKRPGINGGLGGDGYDLPIGELTVPGPTIVAIAGETFTITLDNKNTIPHGFRVSKHLTTLMNDPMNNPGIVDVPALNCMTLPGSGPQTFTFTVPPAGTYFYYDPNNAPVPRAMGLHGAFISLPAEVLIQAPVDIWRLPSSPNEWDGTNLPDRAFTPYDAAAVAGTNVQSLFNDFGHGSRLGNAWNSVTGASHFPGDRWDYRRSSVWLWETVDPIKHKRAQEMAAQGLQMPSTEFTGSPGGVGADAPYITRYFLIDGENGFWSAESTHISLWGNAGMPNLVRNLNCGLFQFSAHTHANHCYIIYDNRRGGVQDNIWWLDVWSMQEGDIKDVVWPFMIPPDINKWPPSWRTMGNGGVIQQKASQFPMEYPMHCHNEMSQTASGGNYPFGAMVHMRWITEEIGAPMRATMYNPTLTFMVDRDILFASGAQPVGWQQVLYQPPVGQPPVG